MSEETTSNATDAALAGVQQAVTAAAPAILAVLASSDPKLQAALLAAQAVAPAVADLVAAYNAGQLNQQELDDEVADLKQKAIEAHDEWLASIGVTHG